MQLIRKIQKKIAQELLPKPKPHKYMKGRHGLDYILSHYLPEKGFFIEAGAFDGITASNTYFLEFFKKWTGILIEPDPHEYDKCKQNRPNSIIYQCALVSKNYTSPTIKLCIPHDLRARSTAHVDKKEEEAGENQVIEVQAQTLSSIIEENKIATIDFISLDVEGYEIEVLHGLDFTKNIPCAILVECLNKDELHVVSSYLADYYNEPIKVSIRDFLFLAKLS